MPMHRVASPVGDVGFVCDSYPTADSLFSPLSVYRPLCATQVHAQCYRRRVCVPDIRYLSAIQWCFIPRLARVPWCPTSTPGRCPSGGHVASHSPGVRTLIMRILCLLSRYSLPLIRTRCPSCVLWYLL